MNPLTLVVLLLVAFYFWSAGATFLALLALVVALIMALNNSQQPAAPAHGTVMAGPGGQVPIIVNTGGNGGGALPRKFEFRPNFPGDPDGDEWISGKLGAWVVLIVRIFRSIFSLGAAKKDEGGH